MKIAIVIAMALLVTIPFAVPADAQAPIPGNYKSTDLGGLMLTGRYSESWSMANGHLQVGNTINKLSWDGATLGTQWWMYCAEISAAPVLIQDTVDGAGNGVRQYEIVYSGGIVILDGNGPWGTGAVPSYTAPFLGYAEIKTFQYANFDLIAVLSTVQLQAEFIGYSDCLTLSISNQEQAGDTDTAMLPLDYPGFLAPGTCAPTRTMGSWGEADDFTLIIAGTCTVPTEEATWSRIKAMYGDN